MRDIGIFKEGKATRPYNNQLKGELLAKVGCEWCGNGGANLPVAAYMRATARGWKLEAAWVCVPCYTSLAWGCKSVSESLLRQYRRVVYDILLSNCAEAYDNDI